MIGLFTALYFPPAVGNPTQRMNEKLDLTLYSVRLINKICEMFRISDISVGAYSSTSSFLFLIYIFLP